MQQNQITTYLEKKSYEVICKQATDILINSNEINVYTAHEDLIKKDELQLSSLVVSEYETKKENYEVVVGKFKSVGTKTYQVVKSINNENILRIIRLMVLDIFSFYGREISEQNLKSTSDLIYRNYYWLKISEFRLFVERMKAGYYPLVHNLSPAVLMERIKSFSDDSLELRTGIGEIKDKSVAVTDIMTDAQKEKFSLLLKDLANKIESKQKVKETNYLHRNAELTKKYHEENEFCLKWLRENEVKESLAVIWYDIFRIRKIK